MNLSPFPGTSAPFSIIGSAYLTDCILHITFEVHGPVKTLKRINETPGPAVRKNELWKTTCFEWFIKGPNSNAYWECNLSPTGEWNVYHLTDYRKNLQEEKLISGYSFFQTILSSESWRLENRFDLSPLKFPKGHYLLNLSAVLETQKSEKTFWSLVHSQKQPDFHHPDHFIMDLKKES
jgi:hypothetical protein